MASMHDPMSTYAQRYDAVGDALRQAERAHECGHLDGAAYRTITAALKARRPLADAEVRYAQGGRRGFDE